MAEPIERLRELNRGFRSSYLNYEELTAQVSSWAREFPDVVRVTSIGATPGGREQWLVIIGPEPELIRPAVWVDGNMHAAELCGSSVALAIAEDVIGLHLTSDGTAHGLPAHVAEHLRGVLFYILPRFSPDGAEAVLTTGRFVRSVPRDERPNRQHARWISQDIDGDGMMFAMRQEDPTGEFVESRKVPGVLVERRLEDTGPFYKVYPEGIIENWDGRNIPHPSFMSDNQTDLNRNFPWSWAPEPEQIGAGSFPASEPESRAVLEFTSKRPHIFAWLNLHTFGGVFIRPLGHKPDKEMDEGDLALFRQIGHWGEELTGYPTVSGFEEFTYEPDKPLRGDMCDYGYHQRGTIAYVCELWDLFEKVGLPRTDRFVDRYSHTTREDMEKLARWDAKANRSRCVLPWRQVEHPQIGKVEVGGIDPRFGFWNPPPELLPQVCRNHAAHLFRVAALTPRVTWGKVTQTELGEGRRRIDLRIENHGYLPTYILSSSRKLTWNEPLHARVETRGCDLEDARTKQQELGHLEGWGRGRLGGGGSLLFLRSTGSSESASLSWVIQGRGEITVRVGSCRVGWIERTIKVG